MGDVSYPHWYQEACLPQAPEKKSLTSRRRAARSKAQPIPTFSWKLWFSKRARLCHDVTVMPKRSSIAVTRIGARIVNETSGIELKGKDPAAVALGRRGGKKGGPARAEKLTPEQRSEIARLAARTRWAGK